MKDIKNKKKLQIMIFVLIAVITLGVGYAAISAINLVINGNATGSPSQNSFSVVFKSASVTTGTGNATIDQNDATIAYFDVSGLSKAGDTAVATYTIKNESNGVGANISLNVTNSNTEYFQVTEAIADTELQANEQTTATITVEVIKTPIEESVTTSITGTLTATPMENADATGSASATATPASLYTYTYHPHDGTYVTIGQPFANGERTFNNFAAAKAEYGHPVVLAHKVSSNNITESYVVFEKDNQIYYLRGGAGNEFGQASMPIYDANVATLKDVFGENWTNYCTEYNETEYLRFYCNGDGWYAYANTIGYVYASVGGGDCLVNIDGRACCDS